MRIVGGSLGGRRFHPPSNIPARPTTDLAREGLFNTLTNVVDLEGIRALELFGGTGGVSYELISRGAAMVTVVEQDTSSVAFIKKTAEAFGIGDVLNVVRGDAFRFLKSGPVYELIFADPPYALPKLPELADAMIAKLAEGGIAVLEHNGRHSFESHPNFLRAKAYGDTIFSYFTTAAKS